MSRAFLIPLPSPPILGNYTMINVHIFSLFILVVEQKYFSGRTDTLPNYLLWESDSEMTAKLSFFFSFFED